MRRWAESGLDIEISAHMDKTSPNQRFVTRRLPVPVGLHVLRYVSAADTKKAPLVIVTPKPDESDGLQLVFAPGAAHDVLEQVGDCVVIRALRPAAVLVTTASHMTARSHEVELRVERLDGMREAARGQPELAQAQGSAKGAATRSASDPYAGIFGLQGHVQKRGDCTAGPDGWLGAAGAVDRIEAFGVSWQRPAPGLRLHYGCMVEDGSQHVAKLPGQLVGSRGRALGIAEVRFELGGKRAGEFELVVSASFQGGAVRTVAGRQIALAGPTGSERLTGLRIGLCEPALALPPAEGRAPMKPAVVAARAGALPVAPQRSTPNPPAPVAAAAQVPAVRPAAERPKIRVFRASRPAV